MHCGRYLRTPRQPENKTLVKLMEFVKFNLMVCTRLSWEMSGLKDVWMSPTWDWRLLMTPLSPASSVGTLAFFLTNLNLSTWLPILRSSWNSLLLRNFKETSAVCRQFALLQQRTNHINMFSLISQPRFLNPFNTENWLRFQPKSLWPNSRAPTLCSEWWKFWGDGSQSGDGWSPAQAFVSIDRRDGKMSSIYQFHRWFSLGL